MMDTNHAIDKFITKHSDILYNIGIALFVLVVSSAVFSCSDPVAAETKVKPPVPDKRTSYYSPNIHRVLDGDTIHIAAVTWPGATNTTKLRVYGVDTPEKRSKCLKELQLSAEAKAFTAKFLQNDFLIRRVKNGKFAGRTLGEVVLVTKNDQYPSKYLAENLIMAKLGVPYFGKTKYSWEEVLCPNGVDFPKKTTLKKLRQLRNSP